MTKIAQCLAGAALLLCGCFPALAQNAPAPGQTPPPQADAAPPTKAACITDTSGFKMRGRKPVYEITLENKCAQRIKCRVYVKVETARDTVRGQATLLLDGVGHGNAPMKSYALKVKMLTGMAQTERQCKVM